jgi:type I restriction enzyme, S subunit
MNIEEIPIGFKLTEFGPIPTDWTEASLRDVAQFINGYHFKPSQWGKKGRPIIRIQNLTGTSEVVNYFEGDIDGRYLVENGDILVSWSASLGVFKWNGPSAWLNQHIFRVSGYAPQVNPDFFHFAMMKTIDLLKRKTRGSTMKHVTRKEFLAAKMPIPPLSEQKEIANILSTVQEAKDKTEKVINALKELKKSTMRHLFTYGPVTPEDASKMSLKETDVGFMPEDWKVVELGQVTESSLFGPRFSQRLYDPDGSAGTLRTTDISDNGEISYASMPTARLDLSKLREHLLMKGDLVVTRSGTCGIAAVFDGHTIPVVPGAFLIRFRLNENMNPHFLKHFLNSEEGRRTTAMLATGAVQKNLTSKALLRMHIPLPTIEVQRSVVRTIGHLHSITRTFIGELNAKRRLSATLLHNLMTGRLRVNNMEV